MQAMRIKHLIASIEPAVQEIIGPSKLAKIQVSVVDKEQQQTAVIPAAAPAFLSQAVSAVPINFVNSFAQVQSEPKNDKSEDAKKSFAKKMGAAPFVALPSNKTSTNSSSSAAQVSDKDQGHFSLIKSLAQKSGHKV